MPITHPKQASLKNNPFIYKPETPENDHLTIEPLTQKSTLVNPNPCVYHKALQANNMLPQANSPSSTSSDSKNHSFKPKRRSIRFFKPFNLGKS
jgi:hypothetical protein